MVKQILHYFPGLSELDVRSTPMGSNGVDVMLSTAAVEAFPYRIECKNQQAYARVYKDYDQAAVQKVPGEPLLIVKINGRHPLAVVDASYFVSLHGKQRDDHPSEG